jgi:hypothetical protein
MRQITVSRQDAEFGLLPSVCIVCGHRSAQTQSVRLFRSQSERGGSRPRGLLSRSLRRSLVVLVPVCGDHQNLRAFRSQSGVRMVALSADSVTLANVAEAFAEQWTAGSARRIAPATPLSWNETAKQEQPAKPIDTAMPADDRESDRSKRNVRPAVQRSSLWILIAMVGIVTPLVIVSGILLLSVIRPPRQRMPRPAEQWRPVPAGDQAIAAEAAAQERQKMIRAAEHVRKHPRFQRHLREGEQDLIDRHDPSD